MVCRFIEGAEAPFGCPTRISGFARRLDGGRARLQQSVRPWKPTMTPNARAAQPQTPRADTPRRRQLQAPHRHARLPVPVRPPRVPAQQPVPGLPTPLGYVVENLGVVPLAPVAQEGAEPDTFTVFGDTEGKRLPPLRQPHDRGRLQLDGAGAARGDDPAFGTDGLCRGCAWPAASRAPSPTCRSKSNGELWRKLELAKRRLISQLLALGLPVVTRMTDPAHGLAFDFLGNMPGGPHVMTGHGWASSRSTPTRPTTRCASASAPRCTSPTARWWAISATRSATTTGTCWSTPTPWLENFRELFGDERADYAEALRRTTTTARRPTGPTASSRLRELASVGGLGRDLGPLPAHGRHAGHRDELRRRCAERGTHERPVRCRDSGSPSIPRRRVSRLPQRLGAPDQRAQRAVAQHGPARLLPLRAAARGRGQAAVHPRGDRRAAGAGQAAPAAQCCRLCAGAAACAPSAGSAAAAPPQPPQLPEQP